MTQPAASFSVLFPDPDTAPGRRGQGWPRPLRDLNLDRVFEAIVRSRADHDLAPLLRSPLPDVGSVSYRHAVFRDLEAGLSQPVERFSAAMARMRSHLAAAAQRDHPYERAAWFLGAGDIYGDALVTLRDAIAAARPASLGLRRCGEYLDGSVRSEMFIRFRDETARLVGELERLRYCVRVRGARVWVRDYRGEPDYSAQVLDTFLKFRAGDVQSRLVEYRFGFQNRVQQMIVDRLALLHPELFASLLSYRQAHAELVDPQVARFDREVQLYLAYLDLIDPIRKAGLRFCFPEVSSESKEVRVRDTFDLALARKLVEDGGTVVVNDVDLHAAERIAVVSGPNQGGKTTFARTFGQLHHLAALGLPVPGASARLPLSDRVLTHFAEPERIADLHSGLEAELRRVRALLERATPRSVVVMNESFASTTSDDQLFLGREILARLIDLDLLAVYVTFIDELSRLGPSVLSLMSTVLPDDPTQRTFKVVRKPADGRAHALVLAQAHGLTRAAITARVRR